MLFLFIFSSFFNFFIWLYPLQSVGCEASVTKEDNYDKEKEEEEEEGEEEEEQKNYANDIGTKIKKKNKP